MVYFDFEGAVDIEVQKNNGTFAQVNVAPLASEVRLQRAGSIVRMTLTKPERFSLQFDDDRLHNLHILAGALPSPRPTGGQVRYFEPGVHTPPAGSQRFPVKTGDRIYLAGGAILRGAFALEGVQDVEISGRGLIYDAGHAIDLNRAGNVTIRDLILVNTEREAGARFMNIRNSENIEVNEVSGFTSGKWADGFNISTSRRIRSMAVIYARPTTPLSSTRSPIARSAAINRFRRWVRPVLGPQSIPTIFASAIFASGTISLTRCT